MSSSSRLLIVEYVVESGEPSQVFYQVKEQLAQVDNNQASHRKTDSNHTIESLTA